MLVRQLFNHPTFSYTYLLADPLSEEAVLIDPIKEKLRDYVQLFNELGYILTAAISTHTQDDATSGLPALRDLWGCDTIAGIPSEAPGLTHLVEDGDVIVVGALQIDVIHTPGHTQDSYCYFVDQPGKSCVFTGDTLLVRTVGLSDQPTSNPRMHYDSLMNVLAVLPEKTVVYPGKDFKGWPLSTIGEEKQFNPYLNTGNIAQFIALKEVQKPADIQPTVVFDEDDQLAYNLDGDDGMATAVERATERAAARQSEDIANAESTVTVATARDTQEETEPLSADPAPDEPATEANESEFSLPTESPSDKPTGDEPVKPVEVDSVPSWR